MSAPRFFAEFDIEFNIDRTAAVQHARLAKPGLCRYCGAPDNGTCAYPSEDKSGCFQKSPFSSSTLPKEQ